MFCCVLNVAALEKNTACFGNKGVQKLYIKVGPVSNRTIPIKSGSTVLILLFPLKRSRVCDCSKASFSCFLSKTYENGLLSFLFFATGIERKVTQAWVAVLFYRLHAGGRWWPEKPCGGRGIV